MLVVLGGNLISCITVDFWQKNPINRKQETFQVIKKDQLVSFAKIMKQETIQFVVVGKDYGYLIQKNAEQIQKLLNVQDKSSKLKLIVGPNNSLRLSIDPQKNNDTFHSTLTFEMSAIGITEEQAQQLSSTLEQQGINTYKIPAEQGTYQWRIYIPIQGKFITLNDKISAVSQQNLSSPYNVEIGYTETTKSMSVLSLVTNIITTPFALVGDAIFVVAVPLAILSDQ